MRGDRDRGDPDSRAPRGTLTRDLQSVWYLAIAIVLPPFFALAAPVPLTAYKLWRVPRA